MPAAQKAPYEKKAADAKKAFEQDLEEFKAQGGVAGSRKKPTQGKIFWTSGQR